MPSRFALWLSLFSVAALAGCGSLPLIDSTTTGSIDRTAAAAPRTGGHVYVFRGIGGKMATLDLDRLAEKINRNGVTAEVHNFTSWQESADEAIKRYRGETQQHSPIILFGHSAGADMAIQFAEKLKEERIPVSLLITLDPTRLPHSVPANVDRFINIYASMNFFGGGSVKSGGEYQGHFASMDLKNYWEVPHVKLLRIGDLQNKLIMKMVRVATIQSNLEGPTVPINYVMPRDEPIELWDSGMPVTAEAGDTVATLAAKYTVPAWALAQINNLDEKATLQPGQRITVPRDLDAPPLPSGAPAISFAAPAR